MYTDRNFKTKKELKTAVAAWNDYVTNPANYRDVMSPNVNGETGKPRRPSPVRYYQPGPFGGNEPQNGTIYVEGPHYPQPHRFYAACEVKDGYIVKVK
jgi:hypothetical protein